MKSTKWRQAPLGDILKKIVGGGTPSKSQQEYWNGDIPWASVKDFTSLVLQNTVDYITTSGLNNSASNLVPVNTIVIPTRMALGKVALTAYPTAINQDLKALVPKAFVDNCYLFQWLIFKGSEIAALGSGSTVKGIRLEILKGLTFEYPEDIQEQQKIAAILSTADDKIELIDQKIKQTEQLKIGLMKNLFSEGIGVQDEYGNWQKHTVFQESIYGICPKNWKVVNFNSLIKSKDIVGIQDGNHGESHPVSADFISDGIPFITANKISRSNKLLTSKTKKISYEQYKSLRIGFSKPGDVILTHKGTVGLTAIVAESDGEIMLSPQTTYYRLGENSCLTRSFLYYFFQSSGYQKLLKQRSMQSTRAYIGITKQAELDVFIPCPVEQAKIAEILSTVDIKLDLLFEQKYETQQLKKGLMQKLLTGEWRVPLDDNEAA
jgi:type I restriction enzyme S subunit